MTVKLVNVETLGEAVVGGASEDELAVITVVGADAETVVERLTSVVEADGTLAVVTKVEEAETDSLEVAGMLTLEAGGTELEAGVLTEIELGAE
jgi:hypothetical protein